MRRFFGVALLISLPLVARACMNDRDSDALVVQNKRLPDALRVISGRFERNPPRYYQMRMGRVERELSSKPRQFGLYDDLAVAHDRLGDDETAMRVMAQKRAVLPAFDASDKDNKEAWYRYFANEGTFRAHRFLHNGAKLQNIAELKRGRAEIARAIQIKPNAHFGRERVQLMVMDWIMACKQKKTSKRLGEWIEARDNWDIVYDDARHKGDSPAQIVAKAKHRRETAEGLAGLVVLGAAWSSPDVFEALGQALYVEDTVDLHYMALLRCRELLQSGSKSFVGLSDDQIDPAHNVFPGEGEDFDMEMRGIGVNATNQGTLTALYPQLRDEADQWNARRAKWMEAKFEQGKHPDTDANFWQSFPETAPPSLDIAWLNNRDERSRGQNSRIVSVVLGWGGILLFSTVLSVVIMKFKRRKSAKTSLT